MAAVVAQLALVAGEASAGETPLWQVEVAKVPTAKYTRDAKVYVTEATQALRSYGGFNSIGIHPPLLRCLKDHNIKFTIHAPSES